MTALISARWVEWLAALLFAVVIGHYVTKAFSRAVERSISLEPRNQQNRVSPGLVGIVERALFTLIVACEVSGAAPAMMGWIAVKMAANWNSKEAADDSKSENEDGRTLINRRFVALLTGAVSMVMAILGGLVAQRKFPIDARLGGLTAVLVVAVIVNWVVERRRLKAVSTTKAA